MIQQMPESLFMPIQIKCLNELAMFFSSILKSMKILLKITSKAFTSLLIEGMPIFLNSIKSGIRVWSFFYAAQWASFTAAKQSLILLGILHLKVLFASWFPNSESVLWKSLLELELLHHQFYKRVWELRGNTLRQVTH